MRGETGENVMGVLPDGFGDDERASGSTRLKTSMPFALGINETVAGDLIIVVRTDEFVTLGLVRR